MMRTRARNIAQASALLVGAALSALIASCGGGGGGGGSSDSSPNNAGSVSLNVEKSQMDSGDKNRVTIEINDLNARGVLLKVHYPVALRYVENSARLFPDTEEETRLSPADESTLKGERYLVFFLYPSAALDDSYISLEFDLKAIKSNPDAFVEVDLDNNDPAVPDSSEFRPATPRFSALERWDVEIVGESTDPTPTPAPTRTPRN